MHGKRQQPVLVQDGGLSTRIFLLFRNEKGDLEAHLKNNKSAEEEVM